MKDTAVELLYLAFQDTDGLLGVSLRESDGEPQDPSFSLDKSNRSLVLNRRPDQKIELDALDEAFWRQVSVAKKIRLLETPEDSSQIIRRYEATAVRRFVRARAS